MYGAGRFDFEPTFEYYGLGFRLANVSEPEIVPAASVWGLVVMTLLLMILRTLAAARAARSDLTGHIETIV